MTTKAISFSTEVYSALNIAAKIAKDNSNPYYAASHILKAILNKDLSLLKQLEKMGKDVYFLEEWSEIRIEEEPKSTLFLEPEAHNIIDALFQESESISQNLAEDEINLYCLLIALSTPGLAFSFDQMKSYPITRNELINDEGKRLAPLPEVSPNAPQGFLKKYTIHKNLLADHRNIYAVSRDIEMNSIKEILCRFSKPNVLILGDSGIGKTTLIHTLTQDILNHKVPDALLHTQLFELDLSNIIAGATYKGEVEDRLKNCINEMRLQSKCILVIEEIHTLLDKNGNDSGVSNILKSELSRGLTLIATSTITEFNKRIEKEQGFANMFEILQLEEADTDALYRMITAAIKPYQEHHKIEVGPAVILEAIRLSKRFLKEKALPESAINLIDHTMSILKTSGETFINEKQTILDSVDKLLQNPERLSKSDLVQQAKWLLDDLNKKNTFLMAENSLHEPYDDDNLDEILTVLSNTIIAVESRALDKRFHIEPQDLSLIISQKTGIPVGKLKDEETQKLIAIETTLRQRVVGQDHCIATVAGSILESRSGLTKSGQPIASFFFLGPTGTGKTELAKSLAEFLFDDENAIIRFDMSEFKEEHSAALLYGAPPGYVGYEEGGLLVNKIRQKPYSIVLFDEIEKAHTSVYDVFLQIMDEGKLHDRLGKEGDFSNAIIIFTSNIGSEPIVKSFENDLIPPPTQLLDLMATHFRPEFLGRLTEIVPFAPISELNALKIFEIHLQKEFSDLVNNLHINVEIPLDTKTFLAQNGYNQKYGARPIKSIIRSHLRRPLAKKIIAGDVKAGDYLLAKINEGNIIWEKI